MNYNQIYECKQKFFFNNKKIDHIRSVIDIIRSSGILLGKKCDIIKVCEKIASATEIMDLNREATITEILDLLKYFEESQKAIQLIVGSAKQDRLVHSEYTDKREVFRQSLNKYCYKNRVTISTEKDLFSELELALNALKNQIIKENDGLIALVSESIRTKETATPYAINSQSYDYNSTSLTV